MTRCVRHLLLVLGVLVIPQTALAEEEKWWDLAPGTPVLEGLFMGGEQSAAPADRIQTTPKDTTETSDVDEPSETPEPSQVDTPASKTEPVAPTEEPHEGPTGPDGISGLLAAVPTLSWTTPGAIESQWVALSNISDPKAQLKAFHRSRLLSQACRGLVDFRKFIRGRRVKLSFRDSHRGRSWADPGLAKTLLRALKKMRRKHKDVRIMVGDISQQGCGPLYFGTLVRYVEDTAEASTAIDLINAASLQYGEPIAIERLGKKKKNFKERKILAHEFDADDRLTLKVAERRYVGTGAVKRRSVKKEIAKLDERLASGLVLSSRRVKHFHPEKGVLKRWRQHLVWPKRKRQIVFLSRRKIDLAEPLSTQLGRLSEIRYARFNPRKPNEMADEVRWVRLSGGTVNTSKWNRWRLVREAAHQTHVSGRDVDLSYVNEDNRRRFMHAGKLMDVTRTWEWFREIQKAGARYGTRLQKIYVSGDIKRRLRRALPAKAKGSKLYRKALRIVSGHGAHHHVRLKGSHIPEYPAADLIWKRMKKALKRLTGFHFR